MTLPAVKFKRASSSTGVVRNTSEGILAIIASSQRPAGGAVATPAMYADVHAAATDTGAGPLAEIMALTQPDTQAPCLLITPTCSTAAAYHNITLTGTGLTVPTAHSGAAPLDDYAVSIVCTLGGTVGTGPISYTYAIGGGSPSAVQALGTATEITIPGTGIGIDLTAATIVTGDVISFTTTAARPTTSDLTAALESLRVTRLPWAGLLIHADADATMVTAVDAWLALLEAKGIFKPFFLNTRMKTAGETESAYATAMGTASASMASVRGFVGADGEDCVSPLTGFVQQRPVNCRFAGWTLSLNPGVNPAFVGLGPVDNATIYDTVTQNPKHHDEAAYPGLDDMRLVTFMTYDQKTGVYFTHANVISPFGSDYQIAPHVMCMSLAMSTAFQVMTNELGDGVNKQASETNPNVENILEHDAQRIEGLANVAMEAVLKGQVVGVKLVLSRTDDLSSNGPGKLTGVLEMESLTYIGEFDLTSTFVRNIST